MITSAKIMRIVKGVFTITCLLFPLMLTQKPLINVKTILPFNVDGNAVVNFNPSIFLDGYKPLSIIQIGDSYVQAGFFADELRKLFAKRFGWDPASIGFVFPYSILKIHDPVGYKSSHLGQWSFNKINGSREPINAELSGAIVQTSDPKTVFWIRVSADNGTDTRFNRIRIFYQSLKGKVWPVANSNYPAKLIEKKHDYVVYEFESAVDSVCIAPNTNANFEIAISGLYLWDTQASLSLSTAGLNGATTIAYLNARLLDLKLKTIYSNLIILTLGTNNAYSNQFSSVRFAKSLQLIIDRIKRSAHNAAIILTTPNDHLLKSSQSNPNVDKVSEIMCRCAEYCNVAVWDFYSLMGGSGSIEKWMQQSLAAPDGIHLSTMGYQLQANLLFTALYNSNFIE